MGVVSIFTKLKVENIPARNKCKTEVNVDIFPKAPRNNNISLHLTFQPVSGHPLNPFNKNAA
jgi:hypothetical protein